MRLRVRVFLESLQVCACIADVVDNLVVVDVATDLADDKKSTFCEVSGLLLAKGDLV